MKIIMVIAAETGVSQAIKAILPSEDVLLLEDSPENAARRLVGVQVDALILDESSRMGLPAVESLRNTAPDTPLLVLSGRIDPLHQANLLHAGVKQIINKPFKTEEVLDALKNIVPAAQVAPAPIAEVMGSTGIQPRSDQHWMALRWLSRVTTYAHDVDALSERLIEAVVDIFDAMSCAFLVEDEEGMKVKASVGLDDFARTEMCLPYGSSMLRWFDERRCLLGIDDAAPGSDLRRQLQIFQGRLAMPLLYEGRVFAVLIVGAKASGMHFGSEERELLALLSRSASQLFGNTAQPGIIQSPDVQSDAIVNVLNMGVITIDAEKRVQMINPEAERLLNVKADSVLGHRVQQIGSVVADVALRVLAEERPYALECVHIHTAGQNFAVHGQYLDGTALLSIRPAVETAVDDTDVAYSPFWEYLSSRVAQEVKNPMVAINTFAQLLPRKYDSEEFRDAFSRVVQDEVQRINKVVEVLFQFSRDPNLSTEENNLTDTVQSVLKHFDHVLEERQITLETHWTDEECSADVDTVYFSQALQNVLQNAVDAMPTGGTLTVSTRMENQMPEVEVTDTGEGIGEEEEALVFLPFYSTREKGMGLGLTIADRIMKKHQGELKLSRDGNAGSRFSLQFPGKGNGHANNSNS